jgi:hypothetical protein
MLGIDVAIHDRRHRFKMIYVTWNSANQLIIKVILELKLN